MGWGSAVSSVFTFFNRALAWWEKGEKKRILRRRKGKNAKRREAVVDGDVDTLSADLDGLRGRLDGVRSRDK